MVKPNINIRITSNIPILISPLVSSYVSEKQIILKELDLTKQVCKNHLADHYMLTPEAIDKLSIKIDDSTVQTYTLSIFNDIRSFLRCMYPKRNRLTDNSISRWILDKHQV